jgi:hypothetical protein
MNGESIPSMVAEIEIKRSRKENQNTGVEKI